jgi:AcrR family transcriptional regulator
MIKKQNPDPRPVRARSKIFRAALRLFAENGGSEIAITELADAAGIARGTVYNNIDEPEKLFGHVAAATSHEMLARTEATMEGLEDPVERVATGLRLFVRRAHEEPDWGRFMVRFALAHTALQAAMGEPPARDIATAIAKRRFALGADQVPGMVSLLTGTTLAAMNAVVRGEQTWKDASSQAAALVLRAAGLPAKEAERIARRELPPLAPPREMTRRKQRRIA